MVSDSDDNAGDNPGDKRGPRKQRSNYYAAPKTQRPARSSGDGGRAFSGPARTERVGRSGAASLPDERVIYGIHAVAAALTNPRRQVRRLLVTENAERRLATEITASGITPDPALPRDLDRLLGADTVHQGVMAEVEPLPEVSLEDLVTTVAERGPIVVLDHVTDPHNVGAVLRSAAVFGAAGIVMTRRHSPPPSGALAKAASGALELVPIVLVQNLAVALAELAAAGVVVIGLDGEASTAIDDEPLTGPIAMVLGAEGKGLRDLTKERCSRMVRIAADGPLASLNVSNAAAIALHLAAMRRRQSAAA